MGLNLQNVLIMLVITLVCSITPITAVQIGNQINDSAAFDWKAAWNEALNSAFIFLNNNINRDTELTSEQHKYLEAHQDLLENKADTILNNTQLMLDYMIQESDKHHENSKKRSSIDDNDDNLKDIEDFILGRGYNITTTNCSYKELVGYFNGTNNTYGIDGNNTIVQVKGVNDVILYLELDNITNEQIGLHSTKKPKKNYTDDEFKNVLVGGDNITIIIVHPDYDRENVESDILDHLSNNLKEKADYYTRVGIVSAALTTVGGAFTTAGTIAICTRCKAKLVNHEVEMLLPVTEVIGNPDWGHSLVPSFIKVKKIVKKIVCEGCFRPSVLIITGILLMALTILSSVRALLLRQSFENQKSTIDKY